MGFRCNNRIFFKTGSYGYFSSINLKTETDVLRSFVQSSHEATPSTLYTSFGKVYTFEPGNYAYSILSKTKNFKRLNNVEMFKIGLSSKDGMISFHIPLKKSGSIGYGTSHVCLEGHQTIKGAYIKEEIQFRQYQRN
ncbi:hypothetical protein IM40_00740 [Candidatus Paracaedimonas acanthamoebae]|nr:hypothetical protein IM40_00740 [Candidatus Paracaedimonas acanthamoebae]